MSPEEQKIADQKAKDEAATAAADKAKADADQKAKDDAKPPLDPVKAELERVNGKKNYTEAEKAAFTLKKNAERVKELGLDPNEVLGLKPSKKTDEDEVDDNTPVTVGMLKQKEKKDATQSAITLASTEVSDDTERELVEYHINNTIRPSGNAKEDLANARAIVNAVKNKQIAEDAGRKAAPKSHNSGAGAPPKKEDTIELTAAELQFTKAPWNLTPKEIVAQRPKQS